MNHKPKLCVAGHNLQEIADFCRCKFTEPLTDEIYRLQAENKRLREAAEFALFCGMMTESVCKKLKQALEQK